VFDPQAASTATVAINSASMSGKRIERKGTAAHSSRGLCHRSRGQTLAACMLLA